MLLGLFMEGSLGAPATGVKAKICLVGDEAVGKTSLIHRFVHGVFDESYIRTLGAVPTKKTIDLVGIGGQAVRLDLTVLDIMGKRTFLQLFREAYFRGARGILAVADVTRPSTFEGLHGWILAVEETTGPLPTVILVNKVDLLGDQKDGAAVIEKTLWTKRFDCFMTSARTGVNVEAAFRQLAMLVARRQLAPA